MSGVITLTNAKVLDGTGTEPYEGHLTLDGARIVEVAPGPGSAGEVIDVGGQVVSPGFIDMHTHSDLQLLVNPDHTGRISQGITTEVLGQDGLSYAPVTDEVLPIIADRIRGWNDDPQGYVFGWRSVAEYLDRLDEGIACNAAYLVPHGNLRQLVVGTEDRPATAAEISAMAEILRAGMEAGAYGMSAGLTYVPAMFSTTDELVELCKVVAEYGGLYVPHHRNYGVDVMGGYGECFDIARQSGVRLHMAHAHLSYPANCGRLPELLALFDAGEADGVDYSFDSYPYAASMSTLFAQFPSWSQVGTLVEQRELFGEAGARARMRDAMDVTGSDGHQGFVAEWDRIVIGGVPDGSWSWTTGLSVLEISQQLAVDPAEAAMDLLLGTDFSASCVMFSGIEEHVQALMQHPRHTVGSDGIMVGAKPHPRAFGTFPRVLGHYVRETAVLSLAEAVRHMTSAPADRLGLADRGRLVAGAVADLVVFDPATVDSPATYPEPHRFAVGVDRVYVNGVAVIAAGEATGARDASGARPGRALRSN